MKKLSLIVLLFSSLAFADRGGWVSSGGELFEFSKNPWFVKNTTDVHYCVTVDKPSFSAAEDVVKSIVQQAFVYWKGEFNQGAAAPTQGFASLANQNFIYDTACSATTDIRFLFGYGSLLKAEIDYLVDPQKYVGVSVRTDYDYVNLRGKGFVYISSDIGPYAYHNPGNLVDQAWQNPKLLQYAVMHETGHIMGLPHTGVGLMSEVFLEQVINKRFSKFYTDNPIQSFLNPPMIFEVCTANGSFSADFFKVDASTACLRLEGSHDSTGQFTWNVFSKAKADSVPVAAGTVKGRLLLDNILGATPAVVIHLPTEQTVFSLLERSINSFMLGPIYIEGALKANFMATGSARPFDLHVDLRNDSITMVGVVNTKQMPVLVYSPPNLLKMLFPVNGP